MKPERYAFEKLFRDDSDFDPAHDRIDYAFIDRYAPAIELLARWFRPSYHGMDNIPRNGPALLVGNHGIIGFDGFFVFLAIYRATGRLPRGLGDYHLFVDPLSRRFWTKAGALPGTPENALRYLKAGHLVNVYPGGARDGMKRPEGRYRLHWERSFGFVRLAMRAQVPIVLHMGIGTDDTYRILGNLRWTGRLLGHDKYQLPLLFGWGLVPRPVKFDYYLSEPILLEGGPDDVGNEALVRANHKMVWDRGHEMLRDGLAKRRSIWWG